MHIFDIERARNETPGCKKLLHFNNAGAALMPEPVITSLLEYTKLEAVTGGYEAQEREEDKLANTYRAGARLLNCQPQEIAFIESATRAWDMAFYSIPFKEGDWIITGMSEYESNYLAFLQVARHKGLHIEVIPNDEYGQLSLQALKDKINPAVKLIAITQVPTNGGLVNPAEEIGKIAKTAGILYLLDACQAAGQIDLDVNKLNCDFLSFTGRKFIRGPRGTGMLYVCSKIAEELEPPLIDLQAATWTSKNQFSLSSGTQRFEQWEVNCGAKIGLGVAIDYALSWGMKNIEKRVIYLAQHLRDTLSDIKNITLRDLGLKKCGIVTFSINGMKPGQLKQALAQKNISISVSSKRYTRLDMEARSLDELCRASVHYYNTEDEIKCFAEQVAALI